MPSIDKDAVATSNTNVLDQIKAVVAEYYKVPVENFERNSKSIKQDDVKLRRLAAYVTRKLFPSVPLKDIGKSLGGFSRIAVHNLLKRASNLIETEKQYRADVNRVISHIIGRSTIQGAVLRDKLNKEYFYVNMDEIKVLRMNKDSAVVFTGVPENIIEQVKRLLTPDVQIKEFKHTGLAILEKRT